MFRSAVLSLAVAAFAATGAPAEPLGFSFRVADPGAPSPVLQGAVTLEGGGYYGALSARTDPAPDRLATGGLRVGVRPRVGRNAFDLAYSQADAACCGAVDAAVSRPLGRGRLGFRLSVDTDTGVSRATTEGRLPVGGRVTLKGDIVGRYSPATGADTLGVEVGVVSALSRDARLDLRLRDASDAPGRAEVAFRVAF